MTITEDGITFHERDGQPFDYDLTYYIAGPMTGLPNFNYPAFETAMVRLRGQGVKVKSPHEPYRHETEKQREGSRPYQEYIRSGIRILLECDGIILLRGWHTSRGVSLELSLGNALAMPVWFYGDTYVINMGDLKR